MYQENDMTDGSSSSSHVSSSGWFADDNYGDLVDRSGRSFRDGVDHLMAAKEKSAFRKSLINYNVNRYEDQYPFDLDQDTSAWL